MTITEYLEKNNPAVVKEYERFLTYEFSNLTVDTHVLTLKYGFCGGPGEIRKVVEVHSDEGYVILSHTKRETRSILSIHNDWWKEVYIMSANDLQIYNDATRKHYNDWEMKTLGMRTD